MTPGRSRRTTRSRIEPIAFRALIAAAVAMIVTSSGCAKRSIDYTQTMTTEPDGTVTVQKRVIYDNEGNDTGFKLLTIGRDDLGNPTLTIEDYKSEDMAARGVIKMAEALQAWAHPAPGIPTPTPAPGND
jgi:hypothetical protein